MDRKTLERIVKLLRLTESDQDAEALSAIRQVNRMLKERGLTWEKLLPVEYLPNHSERPKSSQAQPTSAHEDLLEKLRRMGEEAARNAQAARYACTCHQGIQGAYYCPQHGAFRR